MRKVLKEVLEAYEAHLREEGGRLLGDIQDAVRDVKKAKQLFRSLLERAGLPPFAIEIAPDHKV
jgi:Mg2+ and Co2+ transporter CorA